MMLAAENRVNKNLYFKNFILNVVFENAIWEDLRMKAFSKIPDKLKQMQNKHTQMKWQ